MTEPTTSDNNASDNDDRDIIAQALSAMPRPIADPATREAHLAAALAEFDGIAAATSTTATSSSSSSSTGLAPSNVVSLASRRRTRLMALTAVAAAGLFAVGLGVGRSSAPDNSGDATVKNGTLPSRADTTSCSDIGLAADAVPVARFGTYAVHRITVKGRATVVIVDTACRVLAQIDLGG